MLLLRWGTVIAVIYHTKSSASTGAAFASQKRLYCLSVFYFSAFRVHFNTLISFIGCGFLALFPCLTKLLFQDTKGIKYIQSHHIANCNLRMQYVICTVKFTSGTHLASDMDGEELPIRCPWPGWRRHGNRVRQRAQQPRLCQSIPDD